RYGVKEEVQDLLIEANLLYWASAMLAYAYEYINKIIAHKGLPKNLPLPRLRFVKAAFAYAKSLSPSIMFSYLLEERIQGSFVKYVHNGGPIPLLEVGEPGHDIAVFLCFTQHLQYIQTEGIAFISDYQG
ncbi:hypothetical protein FA13DRAFT_1583991, partial [Coprinellus micaceus]